MSGFRLILLESSVRGETFGKANFRRANWPETFFSFQLLDICQHPERASDQLSGVWSFGLGNFGRD